MNQTRQPGKNHCVRHPRLRDFYNSAFLNACVIGICLSMQCALYGHASGISMAVCGVFCAAFAVYALWFWLGKRKHIATDRFLSEISGPYLLYGLVTGNLDHPSEWWFIFAMMSAAAIILIYFLRLDHQRR